MRQTLGLGAQRVFVVRLFAGAQLGTDLRLLPLQLDSQRFQLVLGVVQRRLLQFDEQHRLSADEQHYEQAHRQEEARPDAQVGEVLGNHRRNPTLEEDYRPLAGARGMYPTRSTIC